MTPNPSLRELIAKLQFDKSASRMAGLELREIIYVQKEYRDRLSPATMLAVLEALEEAHSEFERLNGAGTCPLQIEIALALLNSQP